MKFKQTSFSSPEFFLLFPYLQQIKIDSSIKQNRPNKSRSADLPLLSSQQQRHPHSTYNPQEMVLLTKQRGSPINPYPQESAPISKKKVFSLNHLPQELDSLANRRDFTHLVLLTKKQVKSSIKLDSLKFRPVSPYFPVFPNENFSVLGKTSKIVSPKEIIKKNEEFKIMENPKKENSPKNTQEFNSQTRNNSKESEARKFAENYFFEEEKEGFRRNKFKFFRKNRSIKSTEELKMIIPEKMEEKPIKKVEGLLGLGGEKREYRGKKEEVKYSFEKLMVKSFLNKKIHR
jgi:hypothetical protein